MSCSYRGAGGTRPGLLRATRATRRSVGELVRLRRDRVARNRAVVARLAELGLPVAYDEVVAEAAGEDGVGRPHFAAVLVRHGAAGSVHDAFDRWLGRGGRPTCPRPGSPRPRWPAWPGRLGRGGRAGPPPHPGARPPRARAAVAELAEAGFAGLEALYGRYDRHQRAALCRLAQTPRPGGHRRLRLPRHVQARPGRGHGPGRPVGARRRPRGPGRPPPGLTGPRRPDQGAASNPPPSAAGRAPAQAARASATTTSTSPSTTSRSPPATAEPAAGTPAAAAAARTSSGRRWPPRPATGDSLNSSAVAGQVPSDQRRRRCARPSRPGPRRARRPRRRGPRTRGPRRPPRWPPPAPATRSRSRRWAARSRGASVPPPVARALDRPAAAAEGVRVGGVGRRAVPDQQHRRTLLPADPRRPPGQRRRPAPGSRSPASGRCRPRRSRCRG